jgi:hypothetical protein
VYFSELNIHCMCATLHAFWRCQGPADVHAAHLQTGHQPPDHIDNILGRFCGQTANYLNPACQLASDILGGVAESS